MTRCLLPAVFLCSLSSLTFADVEVAAPFSDHMIIQREQPIKIWGWAEPGQKVTCQIATRSASTQTDAAGKWSLSLGELPAGGPHQLLVSSGDNDLKINDVYVGEVWLCSGQSNMAMTVARANNPDQEAANAKFPLIRMFKVSSGHARQPQERCQGTWSVCSPETVGGFSATAYFFGRRLHKELDVPIGLINSSVGGTAVESWTSMEAQTANDAVAPVLQTWKKQDSSFDPVKAKQKYETALASWEQRRDAAKAKGRKVPRRPQLAARPSQDKNYPSNLYNGKIHPLVGYGIRGAIWYQGERNSNSPHPQLYGHQLETLIADWRGRWGQGDFPFGWVQLPNFKAVQTEPSETSPWVQVREGMLNTLNVDNTGMAIAVDVGEANDIHPKNKQAVGARLGRWALADVYGLGARLPDSPDPMGPIFKEANRQGNRMRITFQYAGDTLQHPESELKGFAIAGKDRKFHWANAKVNGKEVEVWSDAVPEPASVRYSWAANPIGNLFSQAGLPASPFRTDDWDQ